MLSETMKPKREDRDCLSSVTSIILSRGSRATFECTAWSVVSGKGPGQKTAGKDGEEANTRLRTCFQE